jgi:GTPase SAR1 family protein
MDKFKELENRFKSLTECSSKLANIVNEASNYNEGFQEFKQELAKIRDLSSKFADKMAKKEIEVAFAGLEKTGKSALVNAFIEDDVLPSAFERATYIVTEIRYGEQNTVVVEFYTEDEFIRDVLKPFLKAVDYPQRDFISSLDSISLKQFKEYFESLSSKNKELYEKELNRTAKDIIEILEGKEEIKRYLGKSTKMFSKDQKSEYRQFITDKHVSRAVKKVTIYAKALENLKNVIVYDLPGFDSPTFIHSKYTEEKVKEVDAIIFVREARKPDITKPELDILDIIEDTGVRIKEKAFFFLNKVDDLNSIEEIEDVKKKFIEGAKRQGISITEDRVILGSSLAKLHELGFSEYKDKSFAKEKLSRLGLENGISKLHQRLEHYYNNERTEIFDKRANMLEKDLKDLKDKIKEKVESLKTTFSIPIEQYDYIMDMIAEQWKKAIEHSSSEIKNKYPNNKLLSDKLRKGISIVIEPPSQELIDEVRSELELASTTLEEKPEQFNQELRE